mgnify:FL=1
MVPSGIQNIGAEQEIRQLIKDLDKLYDDERNDEELKAAADAYFDTFCCCCTITPSSDVMEKIDIIFEKYVSQERSIIDRFNTQGKKKGYFVEWKMENQPTPKRVGLNVKLNLTRRREFCADNGIEFVSPFGPHFGSATASMTNPDPFPIVSNQPPSYNETFMNYDAKEKQ